MDIVANQGSLIEAEVDVIVNAANSKCSMGGGVAGVIRKAGGLSVESEAMEKAPVAVGSAILTSAGKLPFKGVIHAPTMVRPQSAIPIENVYKSTMAAIRLAQEHGFQSIALPGMGTGIGRVSVEDAAQQMITAIRDIPFNTLELILLVDISSNMVDAWSAEIAKGEHF